MPTLTARFLWEELLKLSTSSSSHEPSDVKVTLNLRTTTSAGVFSLGPSPSSAGNDGGDAQSTPFYIQIHASVKSSIDPTRPVTLATWRTPLERPHKRRGSEGQKSEEEVKGECPSSSPAWLESALTPLRSTADPNKLAAPAELGWIAHRRGGYARDLRESWDFLTVPAAETHKEVVVRHILPRDGLRFYYKTGGEARPEKGEKFVVGPSANALGTFWWRWGDLEGDLADKRFSNEWWDGEEGDGNQMSTAEEDWVKSEGENGFGLTMEVVNEAEIEFVLEDSCRLDR